MPEIPTIEPFQFIRSTAFSERVQLANKLNEVIDALNQIGSVDDLQSQIDAINSEISEIQTSIGNTDTSLAELENQVNALVSQVNGLLKEVVSEVTLDSPGYGQVRVKVIHEDETETASNVLQIPVIQDGGITLISGTTDRSFKIQYITMDGVTHTTNDFVIPEGGGTDVTITSISILQGDTPNDIKFQVGLSDGSSIQSNSYPIPQATITPATTSQIGGIKVGTNLSVTADGTLSVDLSPYALKTEIPDVSDFVTAEDVAAEYQPKGNYLTKVPIASSTTLGGVKIGSGVSVGSDGTISVSATGGATWEKINKDNLPTDFTEDDVLMMILAPFVNGSFTDWTSDFTIDSIGLSPNDDVVASQSVIIPLKTVENYNRIFAPIVITGKGIVRESALEFISLATFPSASLLNSGTKTFNLESYDFNNKKMVSKLSEFQISQCIALYRLKN